LGNFVSEYFVDRFGQKSDRQGRFLKCICIGNVFFMAHIEKTRNKKKIIIIIKKKKRRRRRRRSFV
jgi:hypothetical protein